jgi:hypothetical protein
VVSPIQSKRNHAYFQFAHGFTLIHKPKPYTSGKTWRKMPVLKLDFPLYGACAWFRRSNLRETMRIFNLRMVSPLYICSNHTQMARTGKKTPILKLNFPLYGAFAWFRRPNLRETMQKFQLRFYGINIINIFYLSKAKCSLHLVDRRKTHLCDFSL